MTLDRVVADLERMHPACEVRCGDDCDAPYESLLDLVCDEDLNSDEADEPRCDICREPTDEGDICTRCFDEEEKRWEK